MILIALHIRLETCLVHMIEFMEVFLDKYFYIYTLLYRQMQLLKESNEIIITTAEFVSYNFTEQINPNPSPIILTSERFGLLVLTAVDRT